MRTLVVFPNFYLLSTNKVKMKKGLQILTVVFCFLANIARGQTNLELKKTIDSLYKIDQKCAVET
jgi:hypothetical protein